MGTGTAWPGGNGTDLLVCAAELRWSRPDLVAAIAEHVADTGPADERVWVDAVGRLVYGRSAVGDGREYAMAALAELGRRSPGLWEEPAAARLRVEVALLAVGAGEVEHARDLVGPVLAGPAPADVRADAFGVLARCTAEERPGSVDDPARRAEVAWAEVGEPHAEIGAASVALVAAAALRRAGRTGAATERAAAGLSRLDHARGSRSGSPSRHLAAALAAEWLGSLLDAGRLDEAREGCGPLRSRLREPARPSRQVALLRLTIARAVAGHEGSSAAEALQQAAVDAAAADAPDLEAVCLSTLGALHEQAGRLEAALDAVRRGVEAHRRDAARRDSFLAALASLPVSMPASVPVPAVEDRADAPWDAGPGGSPIGDLVARSLGTSPAAAIDRPAHHGPNTAPPPAACSSPSAPWSPPAANSPSTARSSSPSESWSTAAPWSATRSFSAAESSSAPAPSSLAESTPAPPSPVAASSSAPPSRSESWSAARPSRAAESSSAGRSASAPRSSSAPESQQPAEASGRARTDAGSGRRSAPGPAVEPPPTRPLVDDGVAPPPASTRESLVPDPDSLLPRHDGERGRRAAGPDVDPLFGAYWPDPEARPAVNGLRDSTDPADHPLAGSPWSTGRWNHVRPGGTTSPPSRGRRRARAEPEPAAAAVPVPAMDPPASDDGWLEGALAELDRVWGTSTPDAAAEPRPAPDRDSEVTGCVVVVDVVRSGEPVPGHTTPVVAAVVESVAGHLDGALPDGARLRRDADALSVVMPTRDHREAAEWMHRALPPVFAACLALDGDARLAIRAAVHDVDGPVGAQLIQRLGPTTGRAGTGRRAAGRHGAAAASRQPPAGGGGRRRRADPDDVPEGAMPDSAPGRHGLASAPPPPDPGSGVPERPDGGAPADPRAVGSPGAGSPAAGHRTSAFLDGGLLPGRASERGIPDAGPPRGSEDDGRSRCAASLPEPDPTADARPDNASSGGAVSRGAMTTGALTTEPRSSRRAAADPEAVDAVEAAPSVDGRAGLPDVEAPGVATPTTPTAPSWIAGNTEGMGIADLLAGALAAYRSI